MRLATVNPVTGRLAPESTISGGAALRYRTALAVGGAASWIGTLRGSSVDRRHGERRNRCDENSHMSSARMGVPQAMVCQRSGVHLSVSFSTARRPGQQNPAGAAAQRFADCYELGTPTIVGVRKRARALPLDLLPVRSHRQDYRRTLLAGALNWSRPAVRASAL